MGHRACPRPPPSGERSTCDNLGWMADHSSPLSGGSAMNAPSVSLEPLIGSSIVHRQFSALTSKHCYYPGHYWLDTAPHRIAALVSTVCRLMNGLHEVAGLVGVLGAVDCVCRASISLAVVASHDFD